MLSALLNKYTDFNNVLIFVVQTYIALTTDNTV